VFALHLAFDTQRNSARPSLIEHVLKASVIVREIRQELLGCVFLLRRDSLSAVNRVVPF
jgi:hypothetical protein